MRVFRISFGAGQSEYVIPAEDSSIDQAIALGAHSPRTTWHPPTVELVRSGERGESLRFDYLPRLIGQVLVMQDDAIDALTALLEPFGRVRPLRAGDARLSVFGAHLVEGALDEERSNLQRFSDGGIMMLHEPVFREERLVGVGAFRLGEFARGPVFFSEDLVERMIATGYASEDHFTVVWDSSWPLPEPREGAGPAPVRAVEFMPKLSRVLLPEAAEDISDLMAQTRARAEEVLGIAPSSPVEAVLAAVESFVVRAREDEGVEFEVLVVAAVVLGDQYCRELGWHWVEQGRTDDGNVDLAVVDEEQRVGNRPIEWLVRLVEDPGAEIAIVLNHAMLAAGVYPENMTGELEFVE